METLRYLTFHRQKGISCLNRYPIAWLVTTKIVDYNNVLVLQATGHLF